MAYPYDHRRMHARSRAQREQHVPLNVVRPIVEERDRLRAELETLRRQNAKLSEALESARAERDSAAKRVDATNRSLGAQRAEGEAAPAPAGQSELVTRLRSRVDTLSGDVARANRRAERAGKEATAFERRRLLSRMGEILDSVERALEQVREPGPVRDGITAIRRQLIAFLEAEGVSLTGTTGEVLDPRFHEAIAVVDSPRHGPGVIVRVERHGLLLDDGTIARHAEVVVAR